MTRHRRSSRPLRWIAAASLLCIGVAVAAPDANPGWIRVFGGEGVDVALGLAGDSDGGVVVSGGFQRELR
ncbi:MAG TPA: hypothetical protein VM841_02895, partial [Actinomycetota bacterium]|nr:hypothetical protein [Actinomycetota bacterium]